MKKYLGIIKIALFLSLICLPLTTIDAQVVGGASSSKFCNELKNIPGGIIKCSSDVQGVSFTDFNGKLTAPSTEGYDPTLTRATTLRQFVLNIARFVLGFLGLGAVMIVIYGGVLYVASAGNEENATKGKNAIKYAVIGIIIILGSFALVNTLLQASSGTDQGATQSGNGVEGNIEGATAEKRKLFNEGIQVLGTKTQELVNAYESYLSIQENINELKAIPLKTDITLAVLTVDTIRRAVENLNTKAEFLSELQTKISNFQITNFPNYESKAFDNKLAESDIMTSFPQAIKDFETANKNDFQKKAKEKTAAIDEVNKLIVSGNPTDGLSKSIKDEFDAVVNCLSDMAGSEAKCKVDNASIVKLLADTGTLIKTLSEIQFVEAKINASTVVGSAPLFVTFDALNSIDPSNQTIQPQNFVWNLVGSKQAGSPTTISGTCIVDTPTNTVCSSKSGASTVSAIYKTPGRYRVSLTIKSNEPDKFADGRAFIDIVVEQPSSNIKIKAGPSGDASNRSNIENESVYQVGRLEGQEGIEFTATDSLGKGGAKIIQYKWNFGDGSPVIVQGVEGVSTGGETGSRAGVIVHKFLQEGTYQLILEVVDQAGISDRQIISIVVSSPTARIFFSKQEGEVGEEIVIDGTNSSTDEGQIAAYEWRIEKEKTSCTEKKDIELREKNRERLTFQPEEPGTYAVNLIVTDSTGRTNLATRKLYISSRQPNADLSVTNPDRYKPNQFVLDASGTSDPDRSDKLFYKFGGDGFEPVKTLPFSGTQPNTTATSGIFIAPGQLFGNEQPCKIEEYGSSDSQVSVIFKKKGVHKVAVRVTDEHGKFAVMEKDVEVNSILDVDFEPTNNQYAKNLDSGGRAAFTFMAKSLNATGYEWSFGDDFSSESTGTTEKEATHVFTRAGIYNVTLKVLDKDGDSNSITRRVFVNDGKGPIALLKVSINGVEVPEIDDNSILTISRSDNLSFDASGSLAPDGSAGLGKLRYSWNMGRRENDLLKGPVIDGFIYEDLSPEGQPFKITLQVESLTPSLLGAISEDVARKTLIERTVRVKVIPLPPRLTGIEAQPLGDKLETPLEVRLTAAGAVDPDGKILTYRWWYSEALNKGNNYIVQNNELDSQISIGPSTTMIINTHGSQNDTHYYTFGVELTDNDSQTIRSDEILDRRQLPIIKVVNGPNNPPESRFTVNKTNVLVNESVNFVSSAKDEDGIIASYIWDFEGNGFFDNEKNKANANPKFDQANVAYNFDKVNTEGIAVRLKVYDNNGASAVSEPVRIFVDSISNPPEAAFTYEVTGDLTVTFTDNSQADEKTNQKIEKTEWDFNLTDDADGNGTPDDDSERANVENGLKNSRGQLTYTHKYPDYGIYRVKMTVTDSQGASDSVTRFVNVEKNEGVSIPGISVNQLEARLITNPSPQVGDNKIHLTGQTANITFDYKSSRGPIAYYVIDKNILFDTNGNGINDDDQDHIATAEEVIQGNKGVWTTNFDKIWGPITIRLTVFDREGKKDSVDKSIVFDEAAKPIANLGQILGSTGKASIFYSLSAAADHTGYGDSLTMLALTGGFAILLAGSLLAFKTNYKKNEINQ